MQTLTKFIAASAVAVSLTVAASATQAAQLLATQTVFGANPAPDFTWTNNGVSGVGAGGTLVGSAAGSAINPFLGDTLAFNILPLALAGPLAADFTFTGTSTDGPAQLGGGSVYTQTGLNGSFDFQYVGPTGVFGGTLFTTGTTLLHGVFTGAWIQGAGTSGSTNVTLGNGGNVCYTSDYAQIGCSSHNAFAFNLLNVNPGFGANANMGLNNFTANGNGTFSIPEPGTWALMIMGFGGLGVALRSRRRQQVAFA